MSIEQAVVEKLRGLPLEQQQEVLDFVEFLTAKATKYHSHANQSQGHVAFEAAQRHGSDLSGSDDLSLLSSYPLRGKVLHYETPFEPAVPLEDWEALR